VKIDYKIRPDKYGSHTYWAMLNVQLSLPIANAPRTKRFEALIDSGAARSLFHADIGRFLGLDIQEGDHERVVGVAGPSDSWIHPVRLYVYGTPHEI
jgi:hypothetical protein